MADFISKAIEINKKYYELNYYVQILNVLKCFYKFGLSKINIGLTLVIHKLNIELILNCSGMK